MIFSWTGTQVSHLRALHARGMPFEHIGALLGRSANACGAKAEKLRLPSRVSTYWTDRREEELRRLWADESLSARRIAIIMETTRNSIISKANRIDLKPRGRRNGASYGIKKPRTTITAHTYVKRYSPVFRTEPVNLPDPAPDDRISLLDLKWHHCRAILNDGSPTDRRYCGRKATYRSFCSSHAAVFYRPAQRAS